MGKFKVGDRVRAKEGEYIGLTPGSKYNLPRMAGYVTQSGNGFIVVAYPGGFESPPVAHDSFVLDAPADAGPVRTVTSRRVVPGRYGIVSVGGAVVFPDCSDPTAKAGKRVHVSVGGLGMVMQTPSYGAAELRAAAATFIELADALDEVAA